MIEVFGFVALFILLPFLVPIKIGVEGRVADGDANFRGYARVLLGLLGFDAGFDGGLYWRLKIGPAVVMRRMIGEKGDAEEEPDEAEDDQPDVPDDKTSDKPEKGIRERLAEGERYYTRFKEPVLRLFGRLLKTVRIRCFEVEGVAGAGSPEATGRMIGYVFAAQSALGKKVNLRVQPEFLEAGFRGTVRFELWFGLGLLILAVLSAALSIGVRLAVMYLQERLSRFRQPKTQTA